MANTTNFGWETPDDTDLVKDGALAIRTLGSAIDTSLVDLKGGTTGQILSKNSNTDMDFTWITNDVGDITEVVAGIGLSGGGSSGSVTLTNTVATEFDAKGDLVVGTGADTFDRLALGTNGHVLTADSSTATGVKWAAVAAGGKILQVVQGTTTTATTIASTTFTDTTITATITPSATNSKIYVIVNGYFYFSRSAVFQGVGAKLLRGATEIYTVGRTANATFTAVGNSTSVEHEGYVTLSYVDSPNTTSATTYKLQGCVTNTANSGTSTWQIGSGTSSIILMEIGA